MTFTPPGPFVRMRGAVGITNTGAPNPLIYNVTGTGVWPVTFSRGSLTFSAQTVGTTSVAQTVVLSNNQAVGLTIASLVASGDFTATPGGATPCGSILPANSSCTLLVAFTPGKTGGIKGAVTVTDNATGSPQALELSGTGQ